MTDQQTLEVGDRVQFVESKRWWTVREASADGGFIILTSPNNLAKSYFYTIIDRARGERGKDDRIFSQGYETDEEIAARMDDLVAGKVGVTRRSCCAVEIVKILPPK